MGLWMNLKGPFDVILDLALLGFLVCWCRVFYNLHLRWVIWISEGYIFLDIATTRWELQSRWRVQWVQVWVTLYDCEMDWRFTMVGPVWSYDRKGSYHCDEAPSSSINSPTLIFQLISKTWDFLGAYYSWIHLNYVLVSFFHLIGIFHDNCA